MARPTVFFGVKIRFLIIGGLVALVLVLIYFFRHRTAEGVDAAGKNPTAAATSSSVVFTPRAIGKPSDGNAWITHLLVVDLDQDGLKDILVCDGRRNQVTWIRQVRPHEFEEQDIGESVAGPAHVEVADLDGDGHLDVLVSSMGVIPPSNLKTGSVVVLVNDGTNHFTNRVLLKDVARVTSVVAADLNKDGRLDLVVGQFGYIEGEIRWMENKGDWNFVSHQLLDLPGTISTPVADLDGDGNPDIVALVAQDTEEVHAFMGDGAGHFRDRVLYGSTNKDYGSSGLVVADVNGDGKPDIVYTNGDGFDYATPGSRPWHGVQWLENRGANQYVYHRVANFPGAFSPVVADLNGDGHMDLIACSGFNDWSKKDAVSLMWFENDGSNNFVPRVLAYQPTHLIVMQAADLFSDGRTELVTGSFAFYPPYDRAARVTLWEQKP